MQITNEACIKHEMSFTEGVALITIATSSDKDYQKLIEKGLISACNSTLQDLNKKYHVSTKGREKALELLADSQKEILTREEAIAKLADQLKEIYPKGKMAGTSYYYRCNKTDIIRKLKSFFRRYGNYTDEQVLDATKRYVDSFNGKYAYLRLLKYFIWKDEVKDGETISTSQLADWIENEGQVNSTNNDWTMELN